jgi:hypothetical protein
MRAINDIPLRVHWCVDTVNHVETLKETQSFKTNETGVVPTSAAMLRDLVTIARAPVVVSKTENTVLLAVCGAHLKGYPLHWQITECKGEFVEATATTSCYRMFAFATGGTVLAFSTMDSAVLGLATSGCGWYGAAVHLCFAFCHLRRWGCVLVRFDVRCTMNPVTALMPSRTVGFLSRCGLTGGVP